MAVTYDTRLSQDIKSPRGVWLAVTFVVHVSVISQLYRKPSPATVCVYHHPLQVFS